MNSNREVNAVLTAARIKTRLLLYDPTFTHHADSITWACILLTLAVKLCLNFLVKWPINSILPTVTAVSYSINPLNVHQVQIICRFSSPRAAFDAGAHVLRPGVPGGVPREPAGHVLDRRAQGGAGARDLGNALHGDVHPSAGAGKVDVRVGVCLRVHTHGRGQPRGDPVASGGSHGGGRQADGAGGDVCCVLGKGARPMLVCVASTGTGTCTGTCTLRDKIAGKP